MRNRYLAAAITAALTALTAPARASLWNDEKQCAGTAAQGITPDMVITACDAVIQDGTGGPGILAGAYYNRGLAKLRSGDKAGGDADIAASKAMGN